MILIDALHINNGGGKILLDYLILKLEESDKKIYYLLDARLNINEYKIKPSNQVSFVEANYFKRKQFYKKNKDSFSTVLCFGNLPPNISVDAKVFTYFHQPMFLKIPNGFNLITKLKFRIKTFILNNIKNNTTYWLVQNKMIRNDLIKKYKLNPEMVLVIPFYPPFDKTEITTLRNKFSYLYVSSASPHKNHIRLINAFCNFFDKAQTGELILTVGSQFEDIVNLISEKKRKGYPIKNVGYVTREELHKLYLSSEYLIFPSLAESFGLGLVEAIENGCKVIASDLPYTFEVCKPSITFNPFDSRNIEFALEKSTSRNIPNSQQVITNKIDELMKLVT